MKKIKIAVSLMILLTSIAFAEEKADDKLVAVGDGFKITQKHLADFINYYEKKFDFFSSEKENLNAICRLWVFAHEAKNSGLDKEFPVKKLEGESIEGLIALQDIYINQMTEAFPVSDLAIESYYWAHPDYFYDVKDTSLTPPLHPLTPEIKQKVKRKIAEGKKGDMILKKADDLKAKYNIRICNEGACQ